VGSAQLLDRRLMTSHEAARQLGIPATTVIRWLEGEQRRGTWYPPVLREDPTGQTDVSWGVAGCHRPHDLVGGIDCARHQNGNSGGAGFLH
jgi:hypothetical protein